MMPRVFLFELKPTDLFTVVFIDGVGSLVCPVCRCQHINFTSMSHDVHKKFRYDLVYSLITNRTKKWKEWAGIQIAQYIPIITGEGAPVLDMNIFLLKKEHNDESEITIFSRQGTANVPEPPLQPIIDRVNKMKIFW